MNFNQPKQVSISYFPFEVMTSEAEQRLASRVMQRISARRLAKARFAATLYGVTTILGVILVVPAISYTISLAEQSGFMSYLSLIVSDGASLASTWKPFVLSLLESAPVVGTVLVLASVLVFGYSLMKLVSDINLIKSYRHAAF